MKLRSVGLALLALSCAAVLGCGKASSPAPTSAPPKLAKGHFVGSGPNLLTNGDFLKADASDSSLPLGWKRLRGTSNTAVLVAGEGAGAKPAVEVRTDSEGRFWQGIYAEMPLPESPTVYVVSFEGRVATTGSGRASLVVDLDGEKLERIGVRDFKGKEWTRCSFVASVPGKGAGKGLRLQLTHGDYKLVGSVVQFRDVTVQQGVEAPK